MGTLPPMLAEHFAQPRHVGRLARASARGGAQNPACGDTLEIEVEIEGGRVQDAKFMAHGCSSLIAVASLTLDMVRGRSVADARALELESIVETAGGLPGNRRHAIAVVSRALCQALDGAA